MDQKAIVHGITLSLLSNKTELSPTEAVNAYYDIYKQVEDAYISLPQNKPKKAKFRSKDDLGIY